MAHTTTKIFNNVPRGGNARTAIEAGNAAMLYSLSRSLAGGGAAIATTTSKVKTVNTLPYTIMGVHFSKAATDPLWTLAGTTVAVSSWQKYMLLLDASGTATVQEGVQSIVGASSVGWTNVSSIGPWAAFVAVLADTKACVAMLTIATSSSATFVPGTTALNAAGITATLSDGIDYASFLPLIGNERGTVIGNGG